MKLNEISLTNASLKEISIESMQLIGKNMQEIIERTNYGEFVWKIENWSEKRRLAENGINKYCCSNDFYTHKNG